MSRNSRDRVQRAVHFGRPDRVPISHAVLPAAQLKHGPALAEILEEFRDDFGWDYAADLPLEKFPPQYAPGLNQDDFGTVWRVETAGVCGIPVGFPIPDLDRYGGYRWPADFPAGPPSGRQYGGHMVGRDDRWYARGGWFTYFEQLQQLVGMEAFLVELAAERPPLLRLMDDLLAFNLRWIDRWLALDYDGLHFGDDWGGQTSLLIRPTQWRRLFKPRYAEMFGRVKAAGRDVWFHSDGFINDIAGDLAEIGVDVLNFQFYQFIQMHVGGVFFCIARIYKTKSVMHLGSSFIRKFINLQKKLIFIKRTTKANIERLQSLLSIKHHIGPF